jgi:heme A synthase
MRSGGLGARRAVVQAGTAKAARGVAVAAGLALTAVILGGLTAKIPDAAVACRGFPLCGAGSLAGGAKHVQLTHRIVAYLVALHVLGLVIGFAKRREAQAVQGAVRMALGVVVLQIALGAAMVLVSFGGGGVDPSSLLARGLRSAHQANGILLWLTTFVAAYLARVAAGDSTPAFALPHGGVVDVTTPTNELPAMALERAR